MGNSCIALIAFGLVGCSPVMVAEQHPAPDGAVSSDSAVDAAATAPADAPAAATCNGYEPCGVYPVVVPTGYTLSNGVDYDEYGVYGSCTSFEDCGMWDTHFSENWDEGTTPVDPYYNRMGSPFPWTNSRYLIDVLPKKIMYTKLKITSPGELYVFSDGTPETRTERTTGATTCFQRSAAHMDSALIEDLGGTGDFGIVTWNISVLPGDMGNSGNASTCKGAGNTTSMRVTSDPTKAATSPGYCLLREGQSYYLNFMSSGMVGNSDCATGTCTMGGFALENFTGSDGSVSPVVDVACP